MIYETEKSKGAAELADYYVQNGKGTHAYRYFGVHRLLDRQGWWYVFRTPGGKEIGFWSDEEEDETWVQQYSEA